jgi:hypothetical protein
MPIEIKELHIKAVVSGKEKRSNTETISADNISKLKKEITKDVTQKVLHILKQKNER